jgi:hypothetical protein
MPALDEADALPSALADRPLGTRIVVVDNGSTDGTADVARALGVEVVQENQRGFGAACRAGLLASEPGDIVVFMDADGTLDWQDLDEVVQTLRSDTADLVLGRRVRDRRDPAAMSWHVAAANIVLGLLCRMLARTRIHDISPFRAARRETLLSLGLRDMTYGWPLEMVLRAGRQGLRVAEVPVAYRTRAGRSKVTGRPWPTAKAAARMGWVALRILAEGRWAQHRADVGVVAAILAASAVAAAGFLRGGVLLGMDAVTQYVPWYAWLGEHLRAGEIPVWNPHVFSGTAGIGDPLSGWGSLLVMVPFTLLPVPAALPVHLIATLAVSGVGTYLLARTMGLSRAPAFLAALVAEFGGTVFVLSWCCFAFPAAAAWLPWALLGVERSLGAADRAGRFRGVALAAFSLTQSLTGWFGQGFFYVVLVVGVWTCARCLASPGPLPSRLRRLVGLGAAVVVATGCLAAVAVLPRLEFNAVSNLAGGYPAGERVGGWFWRDFGRLVTPGRWHVGVSVLLLAGLAPLTLWRRRLVVGLALGCVAILVLAMGVVTPLHLLIERIPLAGRLHPHAPQRVLIVLPVLLGMLAAFGASGIARRWKGPRAAAAPLVAVALVATELAFLGAFSMQRQARAAPGFLRYERVNLAQPATAPLSMSSTVRSASQRRPGRFFVFDPVVTEDGVRPTAYSVRWHLPRLRGLPVSNVAMTEGLHDIQGYSAAHVARYDDLIEVINGAPQEYHFTDIRPAGLRSGLLDLLNVRWVIVPSMSDPADPTGAAALADALPTQETVNGFRLLRRPSPLGAAWLVHAAQQVPAGTAVRALGDPGFDPGSTAVIEQAPPDLGQPADPTTDRVEVVRRSGDAITYETSSDAAAILVMSEVWYPGWTATVDGASAQLQPVDHTLRGLAVPAGRHLVTVHAPVRNLAWGAAISAAAALGLGLGSLRRRASKSG